MTESKAGNPVSASLNIGVSAPKAQTSEQPATKKGPDKGGFYWGTGRRKSSVARVRIKPGSGKLLINDRELANFFPRQQDRNSVLAPMQAINSEKNFDIFVNVKGGGSTGQAGAVMLGIARALRVYDITLVPVLRDGGYLTRDSRMVERKKPGQKKARKRFQFSKR
jgi:small subunit ribosomal protein S9